MRKQFYKPKKAKPRSELYSTTGEEVKSEPSKIEAGAIPDPTIETVKKLRTRLACRLKI